MSGFLGNAVNVASNAVTAIVAVIGIWGVVASVAVGIPILYYPVKKLTGHLKTWAT